MNRSNKFIVFCLAVTTLLLAACQPQGGSDADPPSEREAVLADTAVPPTTAPTTELTSKTQDLSNRRTGS